MRHSKWIIRDCGLGETTLLKNEAVFSTVNGYIGVRGNFEEGQQKTIRGAYINGFYETSDIGYDERLYGFPTSKQTIVNIHDFQTVQLKLGDEEFDLLSGTIISFERTIDMKNGVCRRGIEWKSPKGKRVRIDIARMASLAVKELFIIDYRVTPLDFEGELSFVSWCSADVVNFTDNEDPRTNNYGEKCLALTEVFFEDGIAYMESQTQHSHLRVGTSMCHTISAPAKTDYALCGSVAQVTLKTQAKPGEEIRLVKYVHCLDSQSCENIKQTLLSLARQNSGRIDTLYKMQRAYLKKRWAVANIDIESDDSADESLRYCIYQLICHGAFNTKSIPAKGLSGEGYAGHYFWDTEIFIQPFFSLTDPEAAKKLILFRHRGLFAAKQNAALLGHAQGAAFPWRTIAGSECSSFFPAGAAQYHINADIVYALINYCQITGDEALLMDEGAEIIFETARLWMDAGHFEGGVFRIDGVTGPDEYTCMINNNYYTNMLARHNLKWAVCIFEKMTALGEHAVIHKTGLEPSEVEGFKEAYQNMFLPQEDALGITPQDDSFLHKKKWDFNSMPHDKRPLLLHYHPMMLYRYQICKQADVLLAYYLFQKEHDAELMKRSYAYYENITTYDSSLSACIFSIMAARLGMDDKAYEHFYSTIRLDIDDSHGNTKDGLHMANLGGSYLCVLGGFAGLVIDESGAHLAPVLPQSWRAYRFLFMYNQSVFEVKVSRDKTIITRQEGAPQRISLYGEVKEY